MITQVDIFYTTDFLQIIGHSQNFDPLEKFSFPIRIIIQKSNHDLIQMRILSNFPRNHLPHGT